MRASRSECDRGRAARQRTRRLRYAAFGLFLACLVAVSVVLSSGVPSATGPLGVGVDKWLHLAGYARLGAAATAALRARTRRALVVAAAFAVGVGAGVEAVQGAPPARPPHHTFRY